MFEPYNTTYGNLINITGIKNELLKYINTAPLTDLEYEYPTSLGKVTSVYITGYNTEEKELPLWDHPIVLETLKGEQVIVSDVRKYVKTKDELEASLEDIVRDKNGLAFIVVRATVLAMFLNNEVNEHNALVNPASSAMGVWLSGLINTIVSLTPEELFNVEIISSVYGNTLFYKQDELESNMLTIQARVTNSKHIYKLNKNVITELIRKYDTTTAGIESLLNNIRNVVDPDKARLIDINVLVGALGNVWYGPGGAETPIMALENMATWIALLNAVITNKSYAKSRIGTTLNKHKRVIDTAIIERHIKSMIKTEF